MQSQASQLTHNYRRTQIETASPAKLLLMLYDGAITRLQKARTHIDQNEMAEAHALLIRTQDIILELMVSLDWDVGGEIPARLHSLYDFMYRRLVDANIQKDKHLIDEVLAILEPLRVTWAEVIESNNAPKAASAAARAAAPRDGDGGDGQAPPRPRTPLNVSG